MTRHKKGKNDVVTDALSHKYVLLSTLETKFLGFECIKELYDHDSDFSDIYRTCSRTTSDWYLLRDKRLCVPKGLVRNLLITEAYEGGLMGHFGVQKTYDSLHEHFYWPYMKHDVHKFFDKCLLFARKLNPRSCHMVCILHCQFLNILGLTFQWILF